MGRILGPLWAFVVCVAVYIGVGLMLGDRTWIQLLLSALPIAAIVTAVMLVVNERARRVSARKSSESPDHRPTASNPPTAG